MAAPMKTSNTSGASLHEEPSAIAVRSDHWKAITDFITAQSIVLNAAVPGPLYELQAHAHQQYKALQPMLDKYKFADDMTQVSVTLVNGDQQKVQVSQVALEIDTTLGRGPGANDIVKEKKPIQTGIAVSNGHSARRPKTTVERKPNEDTASPRGGLTPLRKSSSQSRPANPAIKLRSIAADGTVIAVTSRPVTTSGVITDTKANLPWAPKQQKGVARVVKKASKRRVERIDDLINDNSDDGDVETWPKAKRAKSFLKGKRRGEKSKHDSEGSDESSIETSSKPRAIEESNGAMSSRGSMSKNLKAKHHDEKISLANENSPEGWSVDEQRRKQTKSNSSSSSTTPPAASQNSTSNHASTPSSSPNHTSAAASSTRTSPSSTASPPPSPPSAGTKRKDHGARTRIQPPKKRCVSQHDRVIATAMIREAPKALAKKVHEKTWRPSIDYSTLKLPRK